jgi:membrane protease subunit HflC
MKRPWLIAFIAVAAAAIVLSDTVYVLDQRQQAVVASLAGPVRVINPLGADDPGLKVKLPFVERLALFDKRSQALETTEQPVLSADRQPLLAVALVQFRVVDPAAFYRAQAAGDFRDRFDPLVAGALRAALARVSAADILSGRNPAMTAEALNDVRSGAATDRLGIEVQDLQIRRVLRPAPAAEAVGQRMIVDLQQRAAQVRSQGEASRREIMAGADRQATDILAHANEQAAAVRGAGDAQAAQLYAAAYGRDPQFAAFYRTMRAYQAALARKDATLVLSPQNDFLKYFRQGPPAK